MKTTTKPNSELKKIFFAVFIFTFLISSFAMNKFAVAQDTLLVEENSPENIIAQRLLLELQRVESLEKRISSSLFNSAIFKSLEDFSKPLPEEQRGRQNPFAPLGV